MAPSYLLPHGEAPEVDVEGVQSGHAAFVLKLDLDLPLVAWGQGGPKSH